MSPNPISVHVESKPSEAPSNNAEIENHGLEAELEPQIHFKTLLVVFAVCSIYVAQLVNIVGAGAFARDIEAIVGHSDNTIWLTAPSTILNVVLGPPSCQLADFWGRKWLLVAMTVCGGIGSIIVSRASSMHEAIAGQVVAGISYGAQPLIHAVASEILPRKWRPYAQAAANAAVASGGVIGLLVGGALTNHNPAGFRTYWYITTGIFFLSASLCALCYNPPRRELQDSLTTAEKLKRLDWTGYGLLASGLVLFCIGLSWSQNPYPWSNAHVLATFIIGCLLSIGLIVYEVLLKKDGLFHHGLFSRGRNFPLSLACVAVEGLAFFSVNNYFAFEMGVLYETDSIIITVRAALVFIIYLVACPLAGLYCSKMKKIRLPSMAAFSCLIIFFILMACLTPSKASGNHVWGYPAFMGAGIGLCLCSLVTAAQLSTPPELISIASGLVIAIRSLGATIGLSIYNAIFNHELSANLAPKIAAAVIPLDLPKASLGPFIAAFASGDTASLSKIEGVTPSIVGAAVVAQKNVYSIAFRNIWITAGCFSFLALIGSSFFVDPKTEFNSHIDAPAETEEELFAKKEIQHNNYAL